ncbi:Brca1 interacting protein helicase 1 brip1 [Striga asiatica]|uniref:DNA 5'-3' helicase FANCJ n=1 Tax=Striga asiatica TaxID=4170 RepID=A0A5A7PXV7_STRAF|nr:Brca1 interacting protein helicase 1 brip1 [Striga asiatica]
MEGTASSPVDLSSSPIKDPNPKIIPNPANNSRSTIHIGGIPVEFPYRPYGTQLAFMNRVISTLDRSQRDGHCHALLESPTGTGKSLSLLCSALAWQQNQKTKNLLAKVTHSSSRPHPEAVNDPLNHGGGFIPETQPPVTPQPPTSNAKTEKRRLTPTIFYSSRTHSQIKQVIGEYRKTSYRASMAVLGSRKHYCTNPHLRGEENVDEQCKLLMKNRQDSCPQFKNVNKVRGHPSLQKGGCHEVHDIEDLVKVGQVVKGCSYFAARSIAQEADLVFCPYNYIINPVIRDAMEIDITGSIIIFDEAHNIEDIARDAGSIDLDEEDLIYLQTELGQLCLNDDMTYRPLFEMTEDILSWIDQRKVTLVKRESQLYFRCWTGDKALKELQEVNISLQNFSILHDCAKQAIRIASEAERDITCLSGLAATILEGLFSSLNYFFSGSGIHACDYELALQRSVKKNEGGWRTTFSLWCMNPAVVFKSISGISQSVILTSGTLSPLGTFSSELGVQFGTCLEAPHVIDVDSQVWVAAISNGPGRYPLNASYKTADEYAFQDAIGSSLEEICKIVPGGCLAFFPSYKLLDKLCNRWEQTGQWSRLNAQKSIFIEPRGSTQDSFEAMLKDYYDVICHGTRQLSGRKIRGKKLGLKNGKSVEPTKDSKKEGAAFLAVCRGKVSEGMDFSDDKARVVVSWHILSLRSDGYPDVVVVGIPFPNIYDVKVAQKKKFNDTYVSSKNLLSGNEWYCQQAFRALNQATGRCIRHRFDYGAVIFLDERFHRDRNRTYISKWLRNSIRLYSSFEESLDGLKSFFSDVKVRIGVAANSSKDLEAESEKIKSVDKKKCTRKKNVKVRVPSQQPKEPNDISGPIPVAEYDSLSTHTRSGVITLEDDKNASFCREHIDLDSDSDEESRPTTPFVEMPSNDIEVTFVKETPAVDCQTPKPEFILKDDYPSPQTNHPFTSLRQQFSFGPKSCQNLNASPSFICSAFTTPKQEISPKANITTPEADSSWSANNNVSKRRKFAGFSSVGPLHEFHTPVQVDDRLSPLASSVTTADANHGSENNKCDTWHTSDGSHVPFVNTHENLQISCLRCKNPLGLPENSLFVVCSAISTSKCHLMSLQKKDSENVALSTLSIDVLVCDISLVDQRLYGTAQEGSSGKGVWCEEDGCVFNTVFCPFCVERDNCLGVQVLATDASNVKFQNKILFYRDRLEIKYSEGAKDEAVSPHVQSSTTKKVDLTIFDKYAYSSPVQESTGWRSTKSRMRLPKKK